MRLYTENGRKIDITRSNGFTIIKEENASGSRHAFSLSDSELIAALDIIDILRGGETAILAMKNTEENRRFLGGNIGEYGFLDEIKLDDSIAVYEFENDEEADEFFRPYSFRN